MTGCLLPFVLAAQKKTQTVVLKSYSCDSSSYWEFADVNTGRSVYLNIMLFDEKTSKDWKPAKEEIEFCCSNEAAVCPFTGKKYSITFCFVTVESDEWDNVKQASKIIKKKKWMIIKFKKIIQ
jgi:hypothetical protein